MKTGIGLGLKAGVGLAVLAAGLCGSSAFAADASEPSAGSTPDDKVIIVTGSIVRNASVQTASPVMILSADELDQRGINTVSGALQALPANNAGTDPTSWTATGAFAPGASAISLRGFNDAYTLTLFNGLRTAYYPLADDGYRTIVDSNTIPDAIVDHIDVLMDGASSTYGSDAVAGVVDVVVKKEITGLHLDMSGGVSQSWDAGERRFSGTYGFGKLSRDGYNFYVNVEAQRNDPLMMNQRGYPYNTANHSSICSAQGVCEINAISNGVQFFGGIFGFGETQVGYAAPYSLSDGLTGGYQLINTAAGCQGLNQITLTAKQRKSTTTLNAAGQPIMVAPAQVCQQDFLNQYAQYSPAVDRLGTSAHFTMDVGSRARFTAMANFYEVKTEATISAPRAFDWETAAGGQQVFLAPLLLPVYVCPQGVGNANPAHTGCNAANGTLNPNNPYAASGQYAQLSQVSTQPENVATDAKTYRFSAGLTGDFGGQGNGGGWNYDIEGTTSWIDLNDTYNGFVNAQNLLNLIATGGYNFADQSANSPETLQYLAPTVHQKSTSRLSEISGSLNKDVLTLPGGKANVAIGGAYRFEGVNSPSANPANDVNPYDRYFDINSVSAAGSRRVYSAYYEVALPVLSSLLVKAEGRYDSYSVGGSAFSPKFEAQFSPIEQIKLRGTYSRGFHAASFSELFAAPTTGFVIGQINCAVYTAFCAAHASHTGYYGGASGEYAYGLTTAGNTALSPEKSQTYSLGTVFAPSRHLSFSVDYWHTKISQIITGITPTQAVFDQYYLNNGVVNIPGITVTKGNPDPMNPNALPLIGDVLGSYANELSELGSGIDFAATARVPLGHHGLALISRFNASYLIKLQQTQADGSVQVYAGTLGPCNITSCSGAPRWRGAWANTLDFAGKGSVTLTANYTSGYADTSADIPWVQATYLDQTPVRTRINATFDLDLAASWKMAEHFTVYGNVLNLLNSPPPFDPTAGLQSYQFNPAWANQNFIGRYFRFGAKVDF